MAAHTSPVYVEVQDRPLVPPPEDAAVVEQVIVGARTWVAELAAVAEPGRTGPDGPLLRRQPRDVSSAGGWARRQAGTLRAGRQAAERQAVGSSGIVIGRPAQSSMIQA